MRILGLDTATRKSSVGLAVNGRIVVRRVCSTGTHAVSLLPLIQEVLGEAGCTARDVEGYAVSGGPGSFTGLRIGLSVAKGLARATGAPLVMVPTLEALARTAPDHDGPVCALLDARKGELYHALFRRDGERWQRITEDAAGTPADLFRTLPRDCIVVGDAVQRYGELLRGQLGPAAVLVPWETHAPCGGVIATMGWAALQAGVRSDAAATEPFYIRPSEAQVRSA